MLRFVSPAAVIAVSRVAQRAWQRPVTPINAEFGRDMAEINCSKQASPAVGSVPTERQPRQGVCCIKIKRLFLMRGKSRTWPALRWSSSRGRTWWVGTRAVTCSPCQKFKPSSPRWLKPWPVGIGSLWFTGRSSRLTSGMTLPPEVEKVTDAGIARTPDFSRTKTGLVLGAPSFRSPEPIAGHKVDGRSDQYSLGDAFSAADGRTTVSR